VKRDFFGRKQGENGEKIPTEWAVMKKKLPENSFYPLTKRPERGIILFVKPSVFSGTKNDRVRGFVPGLTQSI
jgi:hypothetical protein